jgi:hypothetical protein
MRPHAPLREESKRLTSVSVLLEAKDLYFHESSDARVTDAPMSILCWPSMLRNLSQW